MKLYIVYVHKRESNFLSKLNTHSVVSNMDIGEIVENEREGQTSFVECVRTDNYLFIETVRNFR